MKIFKKMSYNNEKSVYRIVTRETLLKIKVFLFELNTNINPNFSLFKIELSFVNGDKKLLVHIRIYLNKTNII